MFQSASALGCSYLGNKAAFDAGCVQAKEHGSLLVLSTSCSGAPNSFASAIAAIVSGVWQEREFAKY